MDTKAEIIVTTKKSNILLEWHEKRHLLGHLKLQNLQNGSTQSGQVHERTFGNRCSTYALPCNGYYQNQRCRLSIQVHIYTHRHADKLRVRNTSERHLQKNIGTLIHLQSLLTFWENREISFRQWHQLHK